jgi:uncharacterized protein (DUF2141 family)
MLALMMAAALAASGPEAGPAEVVFSFSGMQNSGAVMLALYESEASYKKRSKPLRQAKAPVRDGRAEVRFEGLAPGAYAAMVFHDVNGDGKMNFRLKLPTEPYAFSNNARGMPLASWKAAAFTAQPGRTHQQIRLK